MRIAVKLKLIRFLLRWYLVLRYYIFIVFFTLSLPFDFNVSEVEGSMCESNFVEYNF